MGRFLGKYKVPSLSSEEIENLTQKWESKSLSFSKRAFHQDSLQMSSFKGQMILIYIFLENNTRGKATCFILRDRCQFSVQDNKRAGSKGLRIFLHRDRKILSKILAPWIQPTVLKYTHNRVAEF